ncbi:site-2 protease family protein [Acidicapsa ligni]|uniref:site-2 protease family protein n=1 Tax=Acidicapsa ligni TaxID=542300 RepID=UPI0021E0A48D|nr:site-2 protease family protein [Acidicapsa ligni]
MSTITHAILRNCPNCNADLPLEALACPQCHALIHSVRLEQLSKDARALEARNLIPQARELWEYSLTLLPHDSRQAEWVRQHLGAINPTPNALSESTGPSGSAGASGRSEPAPKPNWVKKLGPFGPFALLLLKFKTLLLALFKLKFLFSFAFFIVLYVGIFGWRYGLGISVCILIHELGHFTDIKRRGLPAEMPVFLPGFGAYVRWAAQGVTRRQIAQISLAGPLAGWIAAAICYILYTYTHDPLWAALARTGAVLNILNLIPIWVLDGGQAVNTLAAPERATLLVCALGLWLFTSEGIFLFVAAGFAWRCFTKDKPQQSDWSSWVYYAALLIALGVLMHFTPNTVANQGRQGW